MRSSLLPEAYLACAIVLISMTLITNPAAAGTWDADWKKVDDAVQKGLPKTAIDALQPIITGAIKAKAYPEAIKAIGKKISLEGQIQGNKPEERITRLAAEIEKAPKEMVPVLTAIEANWYWNYFQENRWRFMQRTATAVPPGNDITTWDLPRIYAEIDKQFTAALSHAAELKAIPIGAYDALLQKGTVPDTYRPTLYDFLVHDALAFYNSGEQAGAKAEDAFELSADSPIFSSISEFLAWDIQSTDKTSVTVKALRLYQDLIKFHQTDKDPTALLDADLERLSFGNNHASSEEKNARYKSALKKFADAHSDHELSAMARSQWAQVLQAENSLVDARDVALQGAKAFPASNGGKQCHNIVEGIEGKNVQIVTERVWNGPSTTIEVTYRNITQVHFRAIKVDWVEGLKSNRYRAEWLDQNGRRELLAKKPVLEWSAELPATEDYQQRQERLDAPKNLKPGYYFILASPDPKFTDQNNPISATSFWVSKLAIVMRAQTGSDKIEGFVLDADSGEPLTDVVIKTWMHENNGHASVGPTGKTDKNGMFSLKGDGNGQKSYVVLATLGDQQLSSDDMYLYGYDYTIRPYSQTIFFTDRALYRPGQTIQYKGICIQVDQQNDNYSTIANRALTIIFQDPNNKEIARQQVKSNAYGSFSGSFTAPRDRLTGTVAIRTEGEPRGQTNIHVEEYKRPKFQVTLDAPKIAPKLNGVVSLQGKATAYNGAAIGDAKVAYHVVREVRYPIWWGYYYWWRQPNTNNQEIAHGTAITAADGSFTIEFTAKPDLSVAETDEPTFQYQVSADVTDTSGETRSASHDIVVGYTALQASLTAADWQTDEKPVEITITTQSLDGEGQKAEGSLKIYQLQQPSKVQRADLPGTSHFLPTPRHKKNVGKNGSGKKAIANTGKIEPTPDPSNINSWPLGEVVETRGFTTDASGKTTMKFKLPAGAYRAVLETQDRFGKKVTARAPLQVLKPEAKQFPIRIPDFVGAPKWSLEPNEEFTALWGTGYDKARAYVEIEHRHKIIKSFWTEPGATQQSVKLPVTEAMRGGFTVRVTMVRENRAYLESRHVDVPWSNKDLTLKWEHFVSKLEPAQKETWTAVISGHDAKKAVAEMVAALYDESLDAFTPHSWMKAFAVFYQDNSNVQLQFENSGVYLQQLLGNWSNDYKTVDITYRHFPMDIVSPFTMMNYRFGGKGLRGMEEEQSLQDGVPMAAAAMPLADGESDRRQLVSRLEKEWSVGADAKKKRRGKAGVGWWSYRPARSRFEQRLRPAESPRDGLLLPSFALRRRRHRENGIHDARGAHEMAVPRLRTRCEAPQRLSRRSCRDRQRPDDPAERAPLRSRRGCDRIHRQGLESIGDQPNRHGPPVVQRCPDDVAGRQRARQFATRSAVHDCVERIEIVFVEVGSSRRLGNIVVQGRRIDGPSFRRRRRASARPFPPRAGYRIAGPADSRRGDEAVRFRKIARIGRIENAEERKPDRADGVESIVVCGVGAAVSDGIAVRMQRAGVQSAVCEFARPAYRRQRSENPPHLRSMESHAGAR